MNSCLYECSVMHHRLSPLRNWFQYRVFMFYLDLDEIDEVARTVRFVSRNKFNIFNFRDSDHLEFPRENPVKGRTAKENILTYLKQNGVVGAEKLRIRLLTNLCTWGYQFNPVSFYFCFDEKNEPQCAVIEIGNTFLEQKPYFVGKELLSEEKFHLRTVKHFYVSPFTDLDDTFDFHMFIPHHKLDIKIDNYKTNGTKFFVSTLKGRQVALTNRSCLAYAIRFPFITLKVIFLIHWQALKLWLRGLDYHKKAANPQLQREVYKLYVD